MRPMVRAPRFVACLALLLAGCATQQQMLQQRQFQAEQVALQRARFDMNCPTATATVLSSDFIQPAIQGPWVQGLQRLEYTVGVEGCGERTTVVVMCQEGTETCFATNPGREMAAPAPMAAPAYGGAYNGAAPAPAAAGTSQSAVLTACKADIDQFCSNVPVGGGRVKQCMKSHLSQLSEQCKEALFQAWLKD
ncbi:cysteine rich repeat-containing protein [bacterium]|nr:cysteine rich repeat-containing protein [bacterium]